MNLDALNPIKGLVDGIAGIADKFIQTPDERTAFQKQLLELQDKAEERAQKEMENAREAYIAEFKYADHSSKFNQFVDGISRLVRPVVTYGILLAIFGVIDIPTDLDNNLWVLAMIVFGFWFGGRLLKRDGGADIIKSLNKTTT